LKTYEVWPGHQKKRALARFQKKRNSFGFSQNLKGIFAQNLVRVLNLTRLIKKKKELKKDCFTLNSQ